MPRRQSSTPARDIYYALPAVSMAMLWTPLNVMQGVYIKYYGFPMGVLAVILLVSRVYDAIADVLVGTLSDRHKSKTGRRKPLFALGAILFSGAGLFVYMPPAKVGVVYLTFWLFAFFTSYALMMIPHLAWGTELARASRQKTEIFSYKTAAGYTGLCLFYAVPLLPVFKTSDITPVTIKVAVCLAVVIMVPALILCLRFVPEGDAIEATRSKASGISLEVWRSLIRNRPFLVLIGAYILCGIGLGIWYGTVFIFVDLYLQKGAWFAPMYLLAFGVGIASAAGWNRLARRWGKKVTWSAGMGLALLTVLATSSLTPLNVNRWSLGSLLIVNTIGFVSLELFPASILGDTVDYAMLKNGRNQAATYFSIFMFTLKVISALGGGIGLGLAALLGFDPTATVQAPRGVLALNTVMSGLPAVLLVVAIVVIALIPMDERRHAIIRKRLDQREARLLADINVT